MKSYVCDECRKLEKPKWIKKCGACRKKYSQEWWVKNKARRLEMQRRYRAMNRNSENSKRQKYCESPRVRAMLRRSQIRWRDENYARYLEIHKSAQSKRKYGEFWWAHRLLLELRRELSGE